MKKTTNTAKSFADVSETDLKCGKLDGSGNNTAIKLNVIIVLLSIIFIMLAILNISIINS